jgi:hypothetical protein
MKVQLRITKNGALLYAGSCDGADADSFGKACADAWSKLKQEQLDAESSIGALIEHLDDNVIDRLNGAQIALSKT